MADLKWDAAGTFPSLEEKVLEFWDEINAFDASLKLSENQPLFRFFDGPPFATGLPHYGHLLAGTIKDMVLRYKTQTGFHVPRRFGWDCHGLPVEYEIDRANNIRSRDDVLQMGIAAYNGKCRAIVDRYCQEWKATVRRTARWVDMDSAYRTMEPHYMESVWWVFKQMYDKGLVYRGHRVMPYSTACMTPLSNFEAMQNYKDVSDPTVVVAFDVRGELPACCVDDKRVKCTRLLAWTTTPWTLPSNLGLLVSPGGEYARVLHVPTGTVHIVRAGAVSQLYKWIPSEGDHVVLSVIKGSELAGICYEPLYPFFGSWEARGAFRVFSAAFVEMSEGTGIVHAAPGFGADDYAAFVASGILQENDTVPCPVDPSGLFTDEVPQHSGVYVKDADKKIIRELKERGHILHHATVMHSYPFCWRSDTPLLYRTVPSWFVRVADHAQKLLLTNAESTWEPRFVQEGRFHNWLASARDWSVSRNRFWGTPIPLWVSDDYSEIVCVGSIDELARLSGTTVSDLHRESVDGITIPSPSGRGVLRRVEEVLDCWFESGCVPYASMYYPRCNSHLTPSDFVADFIAEGLDQTRGWFYTLHVLGTHLFNQSAFRHVIVNGLVLAADGKKMSKRLKNYPEPGTVINAHGADAMRIYIVNSPASRADSFRFVESGVRAVARDVLGPWQNAANFLLQNIDAFRALHGADAFVCPAHIVPLNAASVPCAPCMSTNITDRWICSQIAQLLLHFHTEMDAYRLYTAMPRLLAFLEMLTNVYIRYNRRRIKARKSSAAQTGTSRDALHTLFGVVMQLTLMMAPIAPFFAEVVYQRLKSRVAGDALPASVHLARIPAGCTGDIYPAVDKQVDTLRQIVEVGRGLRESNRISLKISLPRLTVVTLADGAPALPDLPLFSDYIANETSVDDVVFCARESCQLQISFRPTPNWKLLGSRLKTHLRDIQAALKELPSQELERFMQTGEISVGGHALLPGEMDVVRVVTAPAGHLAAETDNREYAIVLDMQVLPTNIRRSHVRQLVSTLNKLKKSAGLVITDPFVAHFVISVDPDNYLAELLASPAVKEDPLLAVLTAVKEAPTDALLATTQVSIHNSAIQMWVGKA